MTIEDRDNLGLIDGQTIFNMRLQSLAKATLRNAVVASAVASTSLKVTEKETGADMSVDVQLGSCFIDGTTYTEASDVNLIVETAHATLSRIDLIVYDQSAGNPAIVKGTAAAYPTCPDVGDDLDIPLALLLIPATSASITTAMITDLRCFYSPPESGKYTMVGYWTFPLRRSTNATEGSCFAVAGTTYDYAGYSICPLPGVVPTGHTLVAIFKANIRTSNASYAAYVEFRNDTDAVVVAELTCTDTAEPETVISAELSTGAGNNIPTEKIWIIRIKSANAGASAYIYNAWVEFYSKSP